MVQRRFGFTLEVDIHGMRVLQARQELERLISRCGPDVHLSLIHIFSIGESLE